MGLGESVSQLIWVTAGAVTTLLLLLALVFWIDREWRELDRKPGEAGPGPDDTTTDSDVKDSREGP